MSPILVRPVREQLEHDRVIRLLQVKLKRRHDVTANIGDDQTTPVKIGLMQIYPDLVLTSTDRGHKLMGTVEVETSESVNHLEARAQWAHLGRARAPFHLYVPAGSVEIARRLASENQVNVSEIWTYHTIGDQTRFTLAHRSPQETKRAAAAEAKPEQSEAPRVVARPPAAHPPAAATPTARPAARPPMAPAAKKRPVAMKKRAAAPVRRPARGAPNARKRVAPRKSAATQKRK